MHKQSERDYGSGEDLRAENSESDQDLEAEADMRSEYQAEMRAEYRAEMRAESLANGPSRQELAEWERDRVEYQKADLHHQRAEEELGKYDVLWKDLTIDDVKRFQAILDSAIREEDVQEFLTDHPSFLVQHLSGGHGRYVLPKPKLGKALVPDYLTAEMNSIGIHWHGDELESPKGKLSRNDGQPTAGLSHAVQQVIDWRAWLTNQISHANDSVADGGLGLVGIDGNIPATILMGRREDYPSGFNNYRRQMEEKFDLVIHSYDWLVDVVSARLHS